MQVSFMGINSIEEMHLETKMPYLILNFKC